MAISARYNSSPECCTWWLNSPVNRLSHDNALKIRLSKDANLTALGDQLLCFDVLGTLRFSGELCDVLVADDEQCRFLCDRIRYVTSCPCSQVSSLTTGNCQRSGENCDIAK